MPTSSRPNLWTPRQSRQWFHKPEMPFKSTPYTPPPLPIDFRSQRKALVDPEKEAKDMAELMQSAAEWEEEANKIFAKVASTQDPKPSEVQTAKHYQKRAAMARRAIETEQRAQASKEELKALQAGTETELDAKLGALLHKRRVMVGDIVGVWAKSKGNEHRGQLAKAEFRHEVLKLGLDATPQEVDGLFDSLDVDRSGWLDLNEACNALKAMRIAGEKAARDIDRKTYEVARLQASAARRILRALSSQAESSEHMGEASAEEDESGGMQASGSAPKGLLAGLFSAKKTERDQKKIIEAKAKSAIARMQKAELAQGFSSWFEFAEERAYTMGKLRTSLGRIKNREVFRGWMVWHEQWEERRRLLKVLAESAARLAFKDLIKGWQGYLAWRDFNSEQKEEKKRFMRYVQQLQKPHLLAAFDFWLREWELDSPEQRTTTRPTPMAQLCQRCFPWQS